MRCNASLVHAKWLLACMHTIWLSSVVLQVSNVNCVILDKVRFKDIIVPELSRLDAVLDCNNNYNDLYLEWFYRPSECQIQLRWNFLFIISYSLILIWVAGDLGIRKRLGNLRQTQKGIRELFLHTRLIGCPINSFIRSNIFRYLTIFYLWFSICSVVTTDALKSHRERRIWVLLKSWQGQLVLVIWSAIGSAMPCMSK